MQNHPKTINFLLFINTKSGDGHGKSYFQLNSNTITIKYYSQQMAILYLYDMFNLSSRQKGLQMLNQFYKKENEQYRVIICGGDGTIPWVLSQILNQGLDLMKIVFGIIPIGTGNDFSRSLGWGTDPVTIKKDDIRPLGHLVKKWMTSEIGYYDMWDVQIQTFHDGAIYDIKDQRQIVREEKSFKKMFSNYVGMGLDARVVYTVQKHRTSYAFLNKVAYGFIGTINCFRSIKRLEQKVASITEYKSQKRIKNIGSQTVKMIHSQDTQMLDKNLIRQERPYPLRSGYCGLVCLNCTSYMAGLRKVWKTKSIAIPQNKKYMFQPQTVDDGMLEFVSYKNQLRLALERLLPMGSKVMQGAGPFQINMIEPQGEEITYMQIDGQSIKLKNLKSIKIGKTGKIKDHRLRVMVNKSIQ